MESHNEPDHKQMLARIEIMLGVPPEELGGPITIEETKDKLNRLFKLFAERRMGPIDQLTGPISFELNLLFKLLNKRRVQ